MNERTALTWNEVLQAKRILNYGAPIPGACPKCGHPEYRYLILHTKDGGELLQAFCRKCRYSRYWNPVKGWGLPTDWHNPHMVDDINEREKYEFVRK